MEAPQPKPADLARGLESLHDHIAMEDARPRKRDVLEHFRGKPGVVHARETPGGGIDVLLDATPDGLRRKQEYAEMERQVDRLEIAHTDKIKAGQVMVPVRDRAGVHKTIHAESEKMLGRKDLIRGPRGTVLFGGNLPRCGGRNLAEAEHDYVDGRCEWCGKERPNG